MDYISSAKAALDLGDIRTATSQFFAALHKDKVTEALEGLSECRLLEGDIRGALSFLQALENLSADSVAARRLRAQVAMLQGDNRTAEQELRSLIADCPNDSGAYLALA